MPKLDAIAVTTTDMGKTVAFYELLGFTFPSWSADDKHVEPSAKPGEVRLMIDTAELMEQLTGEPPKAPNHSSFGLVCDTPAEVDSVTAAIKAAGHTVTVDPWDAFWGQRYATVMDPDGYRIDLFAEL